MFAKATAKHLEKYPRFNKFLLLRTDSLNSFDSDNLCNVSIPVAIDSLSNSSTVSYKTSKRSTSSTHKNSVSSRRATQKPIAVIPALSVSDPRDSTSTLPKADSTPPLQSIYDSISTYRISEIALGANHFRVQSRIN